MNTNKFTETQKVFVAKKVLDGWTQRAIAAHLTKETGRQYDQSNISYLLRKADGEAYLAKEKESRSVVNLASSKQPVNAFAAEGKTIYDNLAVIMQSNLPKALKLQIIEKNIE